MDILLESLKKSIVHLETLDKVFSTYKYPEKAEYLRNRQKIKRLNRKYPESFTDELYYGDDGRQMILNDVIEYIFTARGYFYMWKDTDIEKKKNFVKIVLHFINQLMILESISVNPALRNQVMDALKKRIRKDFFQDEDSINAFEALKQFDGDVHFGTSDLNIVPQTIVGQLGVSDSKQALKRFDNYSDSILPKLPHGLWRELIVYIQLLRINAGIIIPMLLNQRIISKDNYMKPTDFLVITENGDLVGVEVGGGKEAHTSDFSTSMHCQLVTATNTNIPPRCPICGKWITFCDKVIEDFSDLDNPLFYIYDDIRCAHDDCKLFSYQQVLDGECPHVKYKGKISKKTKPRQQIKFDSSYHYHYSCILKTKDKVAMDEITRQVKRWEDHLASRGSVENTSRQMTINCLKTNYPYFSGLDGLAHYNPHNLNCYSKYLKSKNCDKCEFKQDCRRLSLIVPIIDAIESDDELEMLRKKLSKFINEPGD